MPRSALSLLLLTLLAEPMHAGCCAVVKRDTTASTVGVRVCEPDAQGEACAAVLFEGDLSVGQGQNVCAESGTVLYQERLPGAAEYEALVTAVCDGADVEI
jgi:hypothetical protein